MNTSACGIVRRRVSQRTGKETDLVNQDDSLPRRGDVEGALKGLIDFCGSNAQIASPNHVQRFANVLRCGLCGEGLPATGRTEEVDNEALALSLNKIVKSEVLVVSLNQGLEQLFPSGGKHKVRESLVVPLDIGDLLDVELDCGEWSEQTNDGEERILTPDLVRKTEAVNDGRSNQQIALFEFALLHFGFSSNIEGGDVGICHRDARIFHATSTHVQTSRLVRLTGINVVGFLLWLREGVIRVQALEGGCSTGENNET